MCLPRRHGEAVVARDAGVFTVFMIGYGEDSCCADDPCDSIGQLVRSWGGTAVMIQDTDRARSCGVPSVVDARGEEQLGDRLVVVTDADATVRGIFRNLERWQFLT